MDTRLRAQHIARDAHRGQVDKAGEPYIDHPARVAHRVRGDNTAETVAWLHDVVEDTPVTLEDLATVFSTDIVTAVDCLTRREQELPEVYYQRVASNPLARTVKLADIADNSDPERLAKLPSDVRARLTQKYAHASDLIGVAPAAVSSPSADTGAPSEHDVDWKEGPS